jgi:ribosomal protein S18 acetylase RimI-like enzyme
MPHAVGGGAMAVEVRPMNRFDNWAQLAAVIREAWRSGHGHLFSEEEIAQVMASAPTQNIFSVSWTVPMTGVVFAAFDETGIIGAANLRPDPNQIGQPALIEPISVSPGHQRQGVGEALWKYLKTFSQKRGDSWLDVYALDRNPKAMGFYRKMGCRLVGTGELRLGAHMEPATHFVYEFV